ncbi:glycosyltransferase family 2 protein [Castellaniella sp.]|uniref:glycosyltransferase family 2 protein n=1 Tax=Castellaniella sp. TaxID=1955812 RepID=UPI00355FCCC2
MAGNTAWRHLFSVVTPTYNRAHTLERVYRSLQEQSHQDFEWVVVDDGSTDDTRLRVSAWQAEAGFPIHYVWQRQQHKKTALNAGIRRAQGEWLVLLDSDDELDSDALFQMARAWEDIPPERRAQFVGITGLCARPDGQVVGDSYPQNVMDVTTLEMTFRHRVRGEKFGCLRTDILRRFPFPEDVAGFVPESLVWRAIARAGYLTRFVNQVFRVYHDSPDSLTRQKKSADMRVLAPGLWLLAHDTLEQCLGWLRHDPRAFLSAAVHYTRFGLHWRSLGLPRPLGRHLTRPVARLLVTLTWPLGFGLFLRDRLV